MADERSDDSPSAEFNSAEAFSLLGDSTRLAILRSLWEAQQDRNKKTVPFEVLRERVGVADSGRFNYHLGKLTNRFITQTDDGYQLRYAGTRVVGALLEGTYAPGNDLDVPTEGSCPECNSGLRIRYQDERVHVVCSACDHCLSDFGVPPGVLGDRDEEELSCIVDTHLRTLLGRARRGICPNCSGPMTTYVGNIDGVPLAFEEETEPPLSDGPPVSLLCDRCQDLIGTVPVGLLLDDPLVVSFLHNHGINPEEMPAWQLVDKLDTETTVTSEDPYQVAVEFETGNDTLTVTIGRNGQTISTEFS
ncbi:helix-turn-helix domain-containing protein [Haladaptatus pallidirubidus]|nr:helix-turn-helix domain-containing protein [Haladaptatus pallidirubidus]